LGKRRRVDYSLIIGFFRLVISLLSRPPVTGAAQRAPYEPRLPALKFYLVQSENNRYL